MVPTAEGGLIAVSTTRAANGVNCVKVYVPEESPPRLSVFVKVDLPKVLVEKKVLSTALDAVTTAPSRVVGTLFSTATKLIVPLPPALSVKTAL